MLTDSSNKSSAAYAIGGAPRLAVASAPKRPRSSCAEIPLAVSLCPPAVRMVSVRVALLPTGETVHRLEPVVALATTIAPDGRLDTFPLVCDPGGGIVPVSSDHDGPCQMSIVVSCPWPRKEDERRLAEEIQYFAARLKCTMRHPGQGRAQS